MTPAQEKLVERLCRWVHRAAQRVVQAGEEHPPALIIYGGGVATILNMRASGMGKDDLNAAHQLAAEAFEAAVLVMEGWISKNPSAELMAAFKSGSKSISKAYDAECIIVNVRIGGEQRLAIFEIDRGKRALSWEEPFDPLGSKEGWSAAGRFVSKPKVVH